MSGSLSPYALPAPAITDAAQPPSMADAWQANVKALGDFIANQRAKSAAMGLWNDQTGMPTQAGLVNAAQQYGNGVMMGTTAPEMRAYHGSPTPGLTTLNPSERGPFGPATYLTPMQQVAQRYGENIYNVQMPDNLFHGSGSTWLPNADTVSPTQVWQQQISKVIDAAPEAKRAAIADMAGKMSHGDGYPFYYRLSQIMGSDDAAQGVLQKAGFKGITGMVDGPEIGYFGNVHLRNALAALLAPVAASPFISQQQGQ